MLYLTVLLTGLITILGWELGGNQRPISEPQPAPRPRNRWICRPTHTTSPTDPDLPATDDPRQRHLATLINTLFIPRPGKGHDSGGDQTLDEGTGRRVRPTA